MPRRTMKTIRVQEHAAPKRAPTKKDARPTDFTQRTYKLCKAIPKGRVTTYGAMAKALNSSARAVGQAMRRNPYAPVVPCHRVIASTLDLGGFTGSWGAHCESVQKKKHMLEAEGIKFAGNKVASKDFVLDADDLQAVLIK